MSGIIAADFGKIRSFWFEVASFTIVIDHSTSSLYVLTQKLLKIHICSLPTHLSLMKVSLITQGI